LGEVGAREKGKREEDMERILGMGKKGREEGWVEMDRMLFSEEGTERVKEFGRKTKWMEKRWE
ncbi:hypothetical protein C7212DRAFT_339844, partial [Tuber magnatum]